jgi:hypothetical protein
MVLNQRTLKINRLHSVVKLTTPFLKLNHQWYFYLYLFKTAGPEKRLPSSKNSLKAKMQLLDRLFQFSKRMNQGG